MRLREIHHELGEIYSQLDFDVKQRNSSPQTYVIENVKSFQSSINKLNNLELFPEQVGDLMGLSIFNVSGNNAIINHQEYSIYKKQMPILKDLILNLHKVIENIIFKDKPDLISVKIPAPQNFDDLEKTSNSLIKIFQQTLNNSSFKGSVKITNFDTGSYWVDFLAGSAEAVTFIGGLVWASALAYKNYQQGELFKQQAIELKLSNDAKKEIEEKSEIENKKVIVSEAEHLSKKFYKNADPEQIKRIELAITELAKLMGKGAEVLPPINSSPEIKEQYPTKNQYNTLESKTEKIEPEKK